MFAHECENKDLLTDTFEDEAAELRCISSVMAGFPKKNKNRPRVAVITNSADPVTVAFHDKESDDMIHLEVEVP